MNASWTSTMTDLPDDETTVLIAFNDGDVSVGYHAESMWWHADGRPCPAGAVTHWADLPEHPEFKS
jgi:hypothetical protein